MNKSIFTIFTVVAVLLPRQVYAQITDPEETQRVIENAEVSFTTGEFSDLRYYNELECDHNIKFLKGTV